MPEAVSTVSKGRIFRKIDQYLANPQPSFLDDLKKPENFQLAKLGEMRGILDTQSQIEHAEQDWFGGTQEQAGWWPTSAQKQEIVRQTYVKATEIALASDPPKPVVTYWVYGTGTFEGMVGESEKQVTVFLLTPPPPQSQSSQSKPQVDEKLWVIATNERIDALQQRYAPADRPPVTATDTAGISSMQVRSAE